mgnify:CR=1 FL=1
MDLKLKGKTALVTGSTAGIGFGIARRLLQEGASVVINGRTEDRINSALNRLRKSIPDCIVQGFVADFADVTSVQLLLETHKAVDILINNAGNNIPEHFTKVKRKNMEYLVKINTISSFNVAQLCALKMIKLKNRKKIGGSIVNMSSQMGHVGGPIRSVYNMNKFGIEGLTKGMAIDLAKYNIRVNSVAPTFVVTPMTKKFLKDKKFKRDTLNNIPLGRFAEVSEIASAVVFLASDAASMITGTSLLVDGGWTAK